MTKIKVRTLPASSATENLYKDKDKYKNQHKDQPEYRSQPGSRKRSRPRRRSDQCHSKTLIASLDLYQDKDQNLGQD